MMVVEKITGKKASFGSKETIVEAFKSEKINNEINLFGDIKHSSDKKKNEQFLNWDSKSIY